MSTRYLLFFRTILLGTLLLEVLYAPEAPEALGWMLVAFPLYGACALALWGLERFGRMPPAVVQWSFVLDIGIASSAMYMMPGDSTDFFVAFFLVILSSTLLRKPAFSFLIAAVACLVYGGLVLPGDGLTADPGRFMKLALLIVIAFFSTFMTSYVRQIETKTAEPLEKRIAWMERLSMVGRALSGVLHEVKTPLGTVVLSVQNVRDMLRRGEDVDEELSVISSEAERASEILANFLEFTKPVEIKLTRLRLADPLEKVAAAMRPRLEERDIVLNQEGPQETLVMGSERHLIQVFTNLFTNAIEAMPSGGTLSVGRKLEEGRASVRITDTGSGIEKKNLEGIFEPYLTTREDSGGTGLGLSIARWIVQKHKGDLLIESLGPGKGAAVTVKIPVVWP